MYKVARWICWLVTRLLFGLEVKGAENIPTTGGAILACNHVSFYDPVAVTVAVTRAIHWMAKEELFRNRLLAGLFRSVHAFPVRRGTADREAIRHAISVVRSGEFLGIFPEGTRNRTGDGLLPLHGGAAMIAIRGQVPVIPIVVLGTGKMAFRRKIKVIVGKPLHFAQEKVTKEGVAEASKEIAEQFNALVKQES